MDNDTISVTAVFHERNGTYSHTEPLSLESKLEDVIGWARELEGNERRLIEVVCAVQDKI